MELRRSVKLIEKWAEERNFFGEGGATIKSQFMKLGEEHGEMLGNLLRGLDVKDDIGDQFVVLVIMNRMLGYGHGSIKKVPPLEYNNVFNLQVIKGRMAKNLIENKRIKSSMIDEMVASLKGMAQEQELDFDKCVQHSYKQIKNRKGEWKNGTFVKESDLK